MLVIGHRGMAAQPENTLVSFKEALKHADMIELDVRRCKTGELVVIHDDSVDRTTNGKGKVHQLTLSEIRELAVGKEKVPLLDEVLELECPINIEIKGVGIVKDIATLQHQELHVSSFNRNELMELRRLNQDISIGCLFNALGIGMISFARKIQAQAIHPHVRFVSRKMVRQAHDAGLKVYVYTVNTVKGMERMRSLGVDGIFTDYPERMT